VPAAGLLLPAIRQRPGSGSARAAQDQPQLAGRDLGKRRQLLHVTGEAERLCVERHGPRDVSNLISDASKADAGIHPSCPVDKAWPEAGGDARWRSLSGLRTT